MQECLPPKQKIRWILTINVLDAHQPLAPHPAKRQALRWALGAGHWARTAPRCGCAFACATAAGGSMKVVRDPHPVPVMRGQSRLVR